MSNETDVIDRNFVMGEKKRETIDEEKEGETGRLRVFVRARFRRLTFRLRAGRDARRCRVEWRRSKPKSK